MKLSVLYTGYLETEASGIVAGSSGSIRLPVLCFLIQAPGRNILFDTGCHPNAMAGHWSPKITNSFRLVQRPEERLEQQLALCGLTPEQIAERLQNPDLQPKETFTRGFVRHYIDNVLQADEGCDFKYLQ